MAVRMPKLVRGLTLTSAASLNIANMIGTGVFLKARVMTCNVETPIAVLAIWLGGGGRGVVTEGVRDGVPGGNTDSCVGDLARSGRAGTCRRALLRRVIDNVSARG